MTCWCSQSALALSLIGLLGSAVVQAGYHHGHPWQQYYTPVQRWGSGKGYRTPRIRTGQGRYRMSPTMAELFCEFPNRYHIMSNVIWERADLGGLTSLDRMYKEVGEEHKFRVVTWENGSRLQLMTPTSRARGLYRCLATGMDPSYPYPVTLFQDVPFYPEMRARWLDGLAPPPPQLRRKPCCLSYDDYTRRTEYHVKSSRYFE